MFFIFLTFGTALFIEVLASLISIIGITKLFGLNFLIISLAVALDFGKITTVSLLYSHWKNLSSLMKGYALSAALITMIITSTGAAGFLSAAFQETILASKEVSLNVSTLKEQQLKYQERKKQIDDQIAGLPSNTSVTQRLRLVHGFKVEQEALSAKIAKIDEELPKAEVKELNIESKAGPILYIAKAFGISVEKAVKYVILLIIFVFDPLAVFLIISGNFLWAERVKFKKIKEQKEPKELIIQKEIEPLELKKEPLEPIKQVKPENTSIIESLTPSRYITDYLKPNPEAHGIIQPIKVPDSVLSPVEVTIEDQLFNATEVKSREQITKSSLGLIEPDPKTIIDAYQTTDTKRSRALKT